VPSMTSKFSENSQLWILRWGIAMAVIYGFCFIVLLKQVPLKDPEWSAAEIARFYSDNHTAILWGAVITSWTSAFMMAILTVVSIQMARVEVGGAKIWAPLALVSGALMSLFQVLPPLFWGAAAYTKDRVASEATAVLHEVGCLIMATTDQYYIFLWVGVSVLCFRPVTAEIPNNPFPRWWGYGSLWITLMFEAGAFAFIPRTGPLAWDGILVFWSPLTLFAVWISIQSWLLARAIKGQMAAKDAGTEPGVASWA